MIAIFFMSSNFYAMHRGVEWSETEIAECTFHRRTHAHARAKTNELRREKTAMGGHWTGRGRSPSHRVGNLAAEVSAVGQGGRVVCSSIPLVFSTFAR